MSDVGISLDFGGVDAIVGPEPVPDGVYVLRVEDAGVVPTNDQKNQMIKCTFMVDCPEGHALAKFNGKHLIDNWFLPNPATQTPEDVDKTKGYLRGKLEMVTGKSWEGDGHRLVPRELAGYKFKALVAKIDEGYGPQNRIRRYMRLDSDTELGFTAPAVPRPTNGRNAAPGAAPVGGAEAASPGRFRI